MTFLGGIKSAEHEQSASMRIVKHLFGIELLSVGVSATITALAYWLIVRYLPDTWQHLAIYTILPISAPLFEKPVFLVPYVWVGLNRARKRNGRWVLISAWEDIKEVLRENEFMRILRADILYHDTGYTSILFLLTVFVPVTSSVYAGVEAAIAFGIAVLLAAYLEVEFVNWRFRRLVKKLKAHGGRCERYLEIRYLVMGLESARAALAKIKRFSQSQVDEVAAIKGIAPRQIVFHDPIEHCHQYWDVVGVTIPRFNDWHSYLLIRKSEGQLGLHVAFWRTLVLPPAEDSVTGLTCVEKIKIRFPLSEVSIDEVQQILARMGRVFRFEDAKVVEGLQCIRTFMAEEDGVSVNVDRLVEQGERTSLGVAEVKAWPSAQSRLHLVHESLSLALHSLPTTQPRSLAPSMLRHLRKLWH